MPLGRHKTSFAIITDLQTYEKAGKEILAYRSSLESDGLSAYVIAAAWSDPMQVRGELKKLYERDPALEGILLLGDIPVARIRGAQHMATAFKKPDSDDLRECTVASDRFYDDLHLEFELIRQDEEHPRHFYYDLSPYGPQDLDPAFYSGRVLYPEGMGGDRYEAYARFLRRAVREREAIDKLDHIASFFGSGYNGDDITIWFDEKVAMDENFPLTRAGHRQARHYNFRMQDYIKYDLMDEMLRPELDVMFFTNHGQVKSQSLSGTPIATSDGMRTEQFRDYLYGFLAREARAEEPDMEGAITYLCGEYNVTPDFFSGFDLEEYSEKSKRDNLGYSIYMEDVLELPAQPRFVMLNSCDCGSFHQPDYIAAYYLFNDGRTVAAQANSINVLQDRWTYEMAGLLSHGVRIGQYNRMIASLEGHIFGDPAFRFMPVRSNTLAADMTVRKGDAAYWRSLLDDEFADVRSLALRMLADAGEIGSDELLDVVKNDEFATTRMEAIKLLSRFRNADFIEAIELGLRDRYEHTRRNVAAYALDYGGQELAPAIARISVDCPEMQRINNPILWNACIVMPGEVITDAFDNAIDASTYLDKEAYREQKLSTLAKALDGKKQRMGSLFDKEAPLTTRMGVARSLRNVPCHEYVPELLALVADTTEDEQLRVATTDALGWFTGSCNRVLILDGCRRTAADPATPERLKAELVKTITRLK